MSRADLLDRVGAGLSEHQLVKQFDRVSRDTPLFLRIVGFQESGHPFPGLEGCLRLVFQEALQTAAIGSTGIRRIIPVL